MENERDIDRLQNLEIKGTLKNLGYSPGPIHEEAQKSVGEFFEKKSTSSDTMPSENVRTIEGKDQE